MLKEFKSFVLRGNVVDLAVGVVIGAAFSGIVTSIVKNLIDPLIALATPAGTLAQKSFCVGGAKFQPNGNPVFDANGDPVCLHEFIYGDVLSSIIHFVIVAAVIFFLVVKPLNHLMTRLKPETSVEETTRECPQCISKIPMRATRCSFCTSTVAAVD